MKKVPLTQGQEAIVDDLDYNRLGHLSWYAARWQGQFYAVRSDYRTGKAQQVFMHLEILPARKGFEVDHKNRNSLDNRRLNLRYATKTQNQANSRKRAGTSSQYKGVSRYRSGKWQAQIQVSGKKHFLGYFTHEVMAAMEYDIAARKFFGLFANTNFVGDE